MSHGNFVKSVEKLRKQFVCSVPLVDFLREVRFECLTWENQAILIDNTVNWGPVLSYPVKITYQIAFLKFLIRNLEARCIEVHDCIYESLGRLVALNAELFCYKHYILDCDDRNIILKENTNFISQGTTGLCTWQAALVLSEWCLQNRHRFLDKNILELGSGIGLTGLTVALIGEAKKIYLTDCHPGVLDTLIGNINQNCDLIDIGEKNSMLNDRTLLKAQVKNTSDSIVQVLNLPWEDIDETLCKNLEMDVILAADIVYDSGLFSSLIEAIRCLLKSASELILACTERNVETLDEFRVKLSEKRLIHSEISVPEQCNFLWSSEVPVRIFSITSG